MEKSISVFKEYLQQYPSSKGFFDTMGLPLPSEDCTVVEYFRTLDPALLEDLGMNREELSEYFSLYAQKMDSLKKGGDFHLRDITIRGGVDKGGNREIVELTLKLGEVICIVGPTGSGKSRLLADIEWMAQGDTPTGRHILLNGQVPPRQWRFSIEHKLVAQLSQNMNFVMDLSVGDFIRMHAESRLIEDVDQKIIEVVEQANRLAGEPFLWETPITSLSGGQSRALMIAETAFLSASPIVLIDEIENAGIDRNQALDLLVKKEKIVLMATHDPILALLGDKRLVIKNGGIADVIDTSVQEKACVEILQQWDDKMNEVRLRLRSGERIETFL